MRLRSNSYRLRSANTTRVSNLHLHMMKNDHPSVATHTTLIIFHSMRLLHLHSIKSHLISIVSSLGLISKNHMVDFIASSGLHGPSIVAMILFIVASLVHQHEALYSHFSTSTRLPFTLAHGPPQPRLILIFTIFPYETVHVLYSISFHSPTLVEHSQHMHM